MKIAAYILLLIFTLAQAGPVLVSLKTDNAAVIFIADEEKETDKSKTAEKKEKKDFERFNYQSKDFSQRLNTAFLLAEKIQAAPCLEKITPPPNFC